MNKIMPSLAILSLVLAVSAPVHAQKIHAGSATGERAFAGLLGIRGKGRVDRHFGGDARVERTGRPVRLQFVVLDEVDAGAAQFVDDVGRFLRPETDARLDDRADLWAAMHARQSPRALHAETRTPIGRGEFVRQPDVEQPQSGDRFQLEEISGHRREQVRQRWPERGERP